MCVGNGQRRVMLMICHKQFGSRGKWVSRISKESLTMRTWKGIMPIATPGEFFEDKIAHNWPQWIKRPLDSLDQWMRVRMGVRGLLKNAPSLSWLHRSHGSYSFTPLTNSVSDQYKMTTGAKDTFFDPNFKFNSHSWAIYSFHPPNYRHCKNDWGRTPLLFRIKRKG